MIERTEPQGRSKTEYHWLHSERASGPAIAQWMNGLWYCIGEFDPITPEEMAKRGWEWLGPCSHRPHSEYLDG